MTLAQHLQRHNIPAAEFSRQSGISIFTVPKWLRGERIPRQKAIAPLMRITGGKVTGNDWLPVIDA